MFAILRDLLTQPKIVMDPYNPGKMLFFKTSREAVQYAEEMDIKDLLFIVVDSIYRHPASFQKLTKTECFEETFKRQEKYQEESFVRYTGLKK